MIGTALAAARVTIEPYLVWVRLIVLIVVCIATACAWVQVKSWRADSRALAGVKVELLVEQRCGKGSTCERQILRLATTGAEKVAAVRQAAQERAQRDAAELATRRAAEVERLTAAASGASAREMEWRRRYESATRSNQSCAAWSAEVVPCPIE